MRDDSSVDKAWDSQDGTRSNIGQKRNQQRRQNEQLERKEKNQARGYVLKTKCRKHFREERVIDCVIYPARSSEMRAEK